MRKHVVVKFAKIYNLIELGAGVSWGLTITKKIQMSFKAFPSYFLYFTKKGLKYYGNLFHFTEDPLLVLKIFRFL